MKEKITFEQLCSKEFRRTEQLKVKSEAVWASFIELDGLINISRFSKKYFDRSHGWFSQKLYGNHVNGKERKFTPDEYKQISAAFRDIATLLESYAGYIDDAL